MGSMLHTEKGRMDKHGEVGIGDVVSELVVVTMTIWSSLGM